MMSRRSMYKGEYEKTVDRWEKRSSIMVDKGMIERYGLNAAVFLGELISKCKYFEIKHQISNDGYFFNTVENMRHDTGLSRFQQEQAISILQDDGVIEVKLKGIPPKRFFSLNLYRIVDLEKTKFTHFKNTIAAAKNDEC